jgi:hypothetical protein
MRAAVAVLLSLLLLLVNVGPVFAQQDHIAQPATLDRLLAEQSAREAADRDVVIDTLRHPEVRRLADRMDVPMERAEAAVRALDGEELAALADQARAAQASLAGGATTIVISSTVIIIALLIIILILVAD